MKKIKIFASDELSGINDSLENWMDEEKPNIIDAKMQKGYYYYEVLVIYDDSDNELLP